MIWSLEYGRDGGRSRGRGCPAQQAVADLWNVELLGRLLHAVGHLLVADGDGHVRFLDLFGPGGGGAAAARVGDSALAHCHQGGPTRQLDAGGINRFGGRRRDGHHTGPACQLRWGWGDWRPAERPQLVVVAGRASNEDYPKVPEDFTITGKTPTRAFTLKTLLRHYA